jgi:hypothetical protein
MMRMPPLDKQAHLLAGAAIASTVTLYVGVATAGFAAAVLAAALKELWDRAGNGTPDLLDFLFTVAGACVVLPLLA